MAGDDGMARDHQAVVAVSRQCINGLHHDARGVLTAVSGTRIDLFNVAGAGDLADDGAKVEVLPQENRDTVTGVKIRGFVFKEVAEVEGFFGFRHSVHRDQVIKTPSGA